MDPGKGRSFVRKGGYSAGRSVVQARRERVLVTDVSYCTYQITEFDLMNHFNVRVDFPDLESVADYIKWYSVVGRQTIADLARAVAVRLWEDSRVMCPHCRVELFRKDGKLLDGQVRLAELLKESKREGLGDGVLLELKGRVVGFWGEELPYDVLVE